MLAEPSPLVAAAGFACGEMLRFVNTPDDDGRHLAADLVALGHALDAFIREIGNHANRTVGVSPSDIDIHFTGVITAALESAIFCIEDTAHTAEQYLRDDGHLREGF